MSRYEPGHPAPQESPPTGHEPLQVSTRALIIFIIVFTIALLAVLAVVAGQYAALSAYSGRGPQPSPLAAGRALPPPPRVQANEPLQLAQLRQYEETRLHGYSWVDRQAGTVRVPIERAMELLVSTPRAPMGAATRPGPGGAQ